MEAEISNISIIELIEQASFFVQLIMFLLLSASVFCWSIIIQKHFYLKKIQKQLENFEQNFWEHEKNDDLENLYHQVSTVENDSGILEIFKNAYSFEKDFSNYKLNSEKSFINQLERFMQVIAMRVSFSWNSSLSILATIGSVSPYVGLLGTVWGIINSFTALGSAKHATISMVAPGIAEALIATAMGLFAAIPAVIFYNIFAQKINNLSEKLSFFIDEYLVNCTIKR